MAKSVSKKEITEEVLTDNIELPETIEVETKEEEKAPEPIEVPKFVTEPIIVKEEPIKVEVKNMTAEEKIVQFIESRTGGGNVRLNEFLKSLYPMPKLNEPPLWLNQGTSKQIKNLLAKMQADGLISIVNNTHELLGKFYHAGEQQITQHRNLNNIEILAKK